MLMHDVANRRQTQAAASGARGEKWLEDPFQNRIVHAASGVFDGNPYVASRRQISVAEPWRRTEVASHDSNFDFDASDMTHRLRRVAAEVQDDLLQLRCGTQDDGGLRCDADQ